MRIDNQEMRQQLRTLRELEYRLECSDQLDDLSRAQLEYDLFNAQVEALRSVHQTARQALDWKFYAFALPPHCPAFYYNNQMRAAIESIASHYDEYEYSIKLQQAWQIDELNYLARHKAYQNEYEKWWHLKSLAFRILSKDFLAYNEVLQIFRPFDEIIENDSSLCFAAHDAERISCSFRIRGMDIIPSESKNLSSRKKLLVKSLPKNRLHDLYQDYVCGCCLKAARDLLLLLPAQYVLVTIMVSNMDSALGHHTDIPVLSALLDRPTIERISFSAIDPSDAMRNFVLRGNIKVSRKSGTVAPIVPITYDDLCLAPANNASLDTLISKITSMRSHFGTAHTTLKDQSVVLTNDY